jgi:anti-sigma factor RsiW
MNTATHPVVPEEVMALLDGELSSAEAHAVSTHLDQCAECADLAGQLRHASQSLSAWTVPPVPANLDVSVKEAAAKTASKSKSAKPETSMRVSIWNWRLWAIGGAGAVAAVLILVVAGLSISYYREQASRAQYESRTAAQPQDSQATRADSNGGAVPAVAGIVGGSAENSLATPAPAPPPAPTVAPMIARSAALTIVVKNFAASRADLDAILARHHGYAAQLTVNTPENDSRSFQASLRVPAPELSAALGELRALGHVEAETQSGEEVTQQHADLVARLKNARETEQRLRDLLAQRTGKIDEVLQVEEEIDRVRGEIESMEAEQKTLEHRVDFATIDLQLTEEYKEKLNSQTTSVSTSMRNAFVAGLRHASGALLGIVLFLEEFGPVLLIWAVILGLPAILIWRKYRKAHARVVEGRSIRG